VEPLAESRGYCVYSHLVPSSCLKVKGKVRIGRCLMLLERVNSQPGRYIVLGYVSLDMLAWSDWVCSPSLCCPVKPVVFWVI
jgi:hypothetical protein